MRHDAHRSPQEIEADIARTRGHIDSTLREIENRLTPEQIIHQAFDYLRGSGANEFVTNLRGSVKHNPLPVSLVGIGLAWLMMADRTQRHTVYDEPATHEPGRVRQRVDQLKASASSVKQKINDTSEAARERASRVSESARHQWERARGGYEHLAHEQPLALGAIGLALGAFMAAVLPRTRKEDELMGKTRDQLAEQAKALGAEQAEKAQRIAQAAGSAAAEEARREDARAQSVHSERLQGSERASSPVTSSGT